MKKLIICILVLFPAPSICQTFSKGSYIQFKQGEFQTISRNITKLKGEVYKYYIEEVYENKKTHSTYYTNKILGKKAFEEKGLIKRYNSNGILKSQNTIGKDGPVGEGLFYYDSGNLHQRIKFKDKSKFLAEKHNYRDSSTQILTSSTFSITEDIDSLVFFHPNGRVKEIRIETKNKIYQDKEEKIKTTAKTLYIYDEKGELLVTNGNGSVLVLNQDGQTLKRGTYKNGLKIGKWVEALENGGFIQEFYTENGEFSKGKFFPKGKRFVAYSEIYQKPEFIGGEKKMFEFIGQNLIYPEQAINQSISGVVLVKFIVEKDGSIRVDEVLNKAHPSLQLEAIKVIKKMSGYWRPGMRQGVPQSEYFTLPVKFILVE